MGERIKHHRELRVYQNAMEAAMQVFELTKAFPVEERYSMTDQIRRSSRSVCANLAEAWRKRRYQNAFVAKLSDAESEACETQVWVEFAQRCGYFDHSTTQQIQERTNRLANELVNRFTLSD